MQPLGFYHVTCNLTANSTWGIAANTTSSGGAQMDSITLEETVLHGPTCKLMCLYICLFTVLLVLKTPHPFTVFEKYG